MKEKKIILLLGFFLSYLMINAQWTQIGSDIDGVTNANQFGWDVSLSDDGLIMAASAPYNDEGGINSGHVRVFQNINGDWIQLGQSIVGATDGEGAGRALSLNADGSIIAIGAPFYNGFSGRVRVYQNLAGIWTQIGQDIEAEDSDELLGHSISLSDDGSVLAVGAVYNAENGLNSGQARIFQNINGSWVQIGSNLSGDAMDDFFGYAISLSADGATVGITAPINISNGSTNIAYTRVFQNMGGNWIQMGADIDSDTIGNQMGLSISLSEDGTTLALGGISADGGNGDHSGLIRIYEYSSGDWLPVGQGIPGEAAWDFFGEAVSLSADGTIVAGGASASDDNGMESGHVRVFRNENGSWVQLGHDITGEAAGDRFGASIALNADGSVLVAGAVGNAGNGSWSGHVRVFHGIISGVEEYWNDHSAVSVFPNPTTGSIQLIPISGHLGQLSVLDVTGRVVYSYLNDIHEAELTIDFSTLANGIYFIRIKEENSFQVIKVIKQ